MRKAPDRQIALVSQITTIFSCSITCHRYDTSYCGILTPHTAQQFPDTRNFALQYCDVHYSTILHLSNDVEKLRSAVLRHTIKHNWFCDVE